MRELGSSHQAQSLADLSPRQRARESEDIVILSGNGNLPLAEKIASKFGKELHKPITVFADGEKKHSKPEETLAGKHAFIIQSMQPNPDERTMEYFIMLEQIEEGLKDNCSIPYLAYMRQDKKMGREFLSVRLLFLILVIFGLDGSDNGAHQMLSKGFLEVLGILFHLIT
jgi:phosphoribosylpyrophosphate synthetase